MDSATATFSLRALLGCDDSERLRSAESPLYDAPATDVWCWPVALPDAATLPGRPWSGRRSSVPTDSLSLPFYAGSLSSYLPWKSLGQPLGRALLLPGLGPAETPLRPSACLGFSAFDDCTGGARRQAAEGCGAPTRLRWWVHRLSGRRQVQAEECARPGQDGSLSGARCGAPQHSCREGRVRLRSSTQDRQGRRPPRAAVSCRGEALGPR